MNFTKSLSAWMGILFMIQNVGSQSIDSESRDDYLHGYVAAILQNVLKEPQVESVVIDGVVYLSNLPQESDRRTKILQTVSQIDGIVKVETIEPDSESENKFRHFVEQEVDPSLDDAFPDADLFKPLLADPLESRFFVGIRDDNGMDTTIGAVEVGEVFGLYRWNDVFAEGHQLQLNLEGAVFGFFDLDSSSTDLQNVDFQIGVPLVYRYKDFSSRFRFVHRSSHLGDDYIRKHPDVIAPDQFEAHSVDNNLLDWTLSYEWDWLRLYGGGAYIFDRDPGRDPWEQIWGFEITPWSYRSIHPVLGAHFRLQEEFDWDVDQRYVFGLAFHDWPFRKHTTKLLLEYYDGQSLQGSFFRQDSEFIGGSIYFEF